MTKKAAPQYKLEWCPVEKATRSQVQYTVDSITGRLIYYLPASLPFGHLEFNGIDISGYFKPPDDDIEYSCRPWMFESTPRPAVPIEELEGPEEPEETEAE